MFTDDETYHVRFVHMLLRNNNRHRNLQSNVSNFKVFCCYGSSASSFNTFRKYKVGKTQYVKE